MLADSNPDVLSHVENADAKPGPERRRGFFTGTGTAPQIAGLRSLAGINAVSMGTDGAALADLDPFADALGAIIEADGDEERVAFFLHPREWKTLLKITETSSSTKPLLIGQSMDANGRVRRSIYGRPVYLSSQLPTDETQGASVGVASSAYAVDMSRVIVVSRQDGRVDLDPSSAFTSDSAHIRAKARLALYVPDETAVSRVSGIIVA